MTKCYSSIFKVKFFAALICLLSVLPSKAQTDISMGTGATGNSTTTYPCPLQDYYEGSRMQYLYLASELTAAGMGPGNISAMKFNVVSLGTAGVIEQHLIRIGGTATNSLTATSWETVSQTVYGPVNYQPVAGINTFTFSAPYIWNGTDNIVVEICGGDPANAASVTYTVNPVVPWTTALSFNGSHTYRADDLGNLCGTATTTNTGTQTTRPNIIYAWTPAALCTGTPNAGTAVANPSMVCLGSSFTLSLSGSTSASGITYQWQSSVDNVNFVNIAGANSSSYTGTQSTSNYYRAITVCTPGGGSDTSTHVLVTTPAAVSGTFTINSAVATGGTNFQTFNDAYNYIKCGISGPVIFNVVSTSGPYNEQLIMTPVPGASAANTVTFNGNGRVLTFLSTTTGERAVIKLNGADHIKINDLVINATGTSATEYGFGVQLLNDADSNAVNGCTININTTSTSTNYAGIVVSASATSATTTGNTLSDGNIFNNNTITGGYYGITLVGSTTAANRDNQITRNTIREFYFYGVYVSGTFNTLIDSNRLSRPTRVDVSTFNGIYFTSLSVSANVTRNTITNPFGGAPTSSSAMNGIYFTGVDALGGLNNIVSNNLMYNFTGNGIISALHNSSSDNVLYYHNTISLDGTGTAIARGFYQITTAGGIEVFNNIITVTRSGTGASYSIYYATTTSDITSDKNDLFINAPSGNAFTGFFTTARATLIDWQTVSGDDANSVATNPIYQDAASGNYRPTNASIDNLGIPKGVLIDILGNTRSLVTPDLGAYEFTPGNCAAPPTPGTAIVGATPVCVNVSVSLGLSGSSTGTGQTYQWQTSGSATGPFTTIGNVLTNPDTTIISSATLYYRVAVTCTGNTTFSTPVLLTVNPALPGGTYTINAGSAPSATNFISFNAAKAAMMCGIAGPVVMNVVNGSGPYNEQLILDSIPGTSAINTITFNGNDNTIAFSSNATDERAVIKFVGADHITFNNLTINATGAGTYGFGVQLLSNADSNTINNCIILVNTTSTSTNYAGISVSASATSATTTGNTFCDGNVFSNNTITGGYYSITLVGSTTAAVRDNKIINNTIRDFYFYGIYLSGNFNTLVESNNISRPTRTIVSTFNGIYVTSLNVSIDISKNTIHNPFGGAPTSSSVFYGIYITGVDAIPGLENTVSNNQIYNVNGEGTVYGLNNTSSDNVQYYFNTVSLDNTTNTSTALTYGFYQTTLADGLELKNNIFTVTRSGGANRFGLYFNTSTSTILSDFNDIYVPGTNGFVGYNGTNRITLAQWQAATAQDANSFSTNPFYTNVATGNLRPQSPVIDNKATPIPGITTDIVNALRSAATPDIGAYEFTVPPCTTPPIPGNATANPSSGICLGAPINLALTGSGVGSGQTYQWQFSTTIAGPYTNLGGSLLFADTTIFATTTLYYRAAVTCGGNTTFSTPVLVSINPAFLAGTYTINKTIPASATNFTSFTAAVAALDCGITGPVFFDVAPNTYTEQVRMHAVAGTSPSVRVTFRSANGVPASVNLTFDATAAASNYVLKLDSASYITFRNMTITATNATNGRAIELANTASNDSLVNLDIVASVSTGTTNTSAGIYADLLRGSNNVIKGNTITNGSSGIYFEGTSAANLSYDNIIDSNTINNSYYYGLYTGFNGRLQVTKNTVNVTSPRNTTNYGTYSTGNDSSYQFVGNKVNINGITSSITYGMYFTANDATVNARGRIANNMIIGLTGNTGTLYGLYQTGNTFINTVNNVISINTTGATSYGSYSTGSGGVNFHNNSVLNTSSSATVNNIAAYFAQTSGLNPSINIQNNIFSHEGGGRAMYVTNVNFIYSDYNTFNSNGATLIQWNTNTYATLKAWRDTSFWDLNSIAFAPAFASISTLLPDLAKPDVWAIHGRGTQIAGNTYDFNNNPRPVTFTTGVPDMGAYEFLPTALPTLLTPTPALPAPGITQTFMYGTDTVAKVTYNASAPVPASISLRRYSGVLPTGLSAGQQSMYFYTDIDVPVQGAYKYTMQQYYIDPWKGFIPTEPQIKLGRTIPSGPWVASDSSTVDTDANIIADTSLIYFDKYTGLAGTPTIPQNVYTTVLDSSNRGTRFWVPYGHHYSFSSNSQDMWLYLSAEQAANVTVKVNGTSYSRTYAVGANSVRVSEIIPKFGLIDARITDEGLFKRGISITSDVPIVAYAHIYDGATSGASLLLPVGVYGYEYQSLNARQYYPTGGAGSYSWFSVISDRDSTLVEITPSVITKAGRPSGLPFTVLLMRGEVYNVMGTITGTGAGSDLSGSTIRSIANASGNCYPIAVFSGSSRTAICNTTNGDNLIQQVFPSQAWGKKYLAFPTANSTSNTLYNSNIFRVMVKDLSTVVRKNGVNLDPATLVTPGNYYEFSTTSGSASNGAIYVEADKPVMVGQYMVSTGANSCPGVTATGNGDPEMIYISPIEQGIKKAVFYNTNESSISSNYVNILIPTAGLASLRIDGIATFTDVFVHPFLAGYSGVRHNLGATPGQHVVTSDSAFNAITYGLGSVESYGYNAGTLVKNLNALPSIVNTLGSGTAAQYTCVKAPFRFNVSITAKPQVLTWKLSAINTLTPNANVVQNNPVPVDSTFSNGRWFYKYTITTNYTFTAPGTYYVPILIKDTSSIEGCSNTAEIILPVTVIAAPVPDFTSVFAGCLGTAALFNGSGTSSTGSLINSYTWNFGDTTTATGQNTSHTYLSAGTFNVNLKIVTADGCIGDTTKQIVVNALPSAAVIKDTLIVCGNSPATFQIMNPVSGTSYNWYTVPTGGTPVFTGTSYTIPNVTGTVVFYVGATNASGCVSNRTRVSASILPDLAIPIVVVDSVGTDRVVFRWNAVPNALTYEVTINNGNTWLTPSSGPTGLTHTVTGLQPLDQVSLIVRAKGQVSCQVSVSLTVSARTLPDQIYIPNAFSPNGDGTNDLLLVYGYTIKSMRMIIFNQWGEKIFENNNQSTGWNGTYKGKVQPSGVYMYVCQITLKDGSTLLKKGSINLVR